MARLGKSRFVNRVALRKAIRGFNLNAMRGAFIPEYNRWASKIQQRARANAPKKTGRLKGNIRKSFKIRPSKRRGWNTTRQGLFYVHSRSIQDHIIHEGVPKMRLSGKELTKRSRKWRGRIHRPKPAGDFSKGGGQSRANRYNGKDWAFGARKANPFLNKGGNSTQNLANEQKEVARKIGKNITRWIGREFLKNVGAKK